MLTIPWISVIREIGAQSTVKIDFTLFDNEWEQLWKLSGHAVDILFDPDEITEEARSGK